MSGSISIIHADTMIAQKPARSRGEICARISESMACDERVLVPNVVLVGDVVELVATFKSASLNGKLSH